MGRRSRRMVVGEEEGEGGGGRGRGRRQRMACGPGRPVDL